jgi:hypothetical protein
MGNIVLTKTPPAEQGLVHRSPGESPPYKSHCSIECRLEIVQVVEVSSLLDDTMDREVSVVLLDECSIHQFLDSGLKLRRWIDDVSKRNHVAFIDVPCILLAKF